MNAELDEFERAVTAMLRARCTPQHLTDCEGGLDTSLWTELADGGFTRVGTPEDAGGSGGTLAEAATIVRQAGAFSAQVPVAEAAIIAGPLLADAGLEIPDGVITAGFGQVEAARAGSQWQLRGELPRVAYGRCASHVVGVASAGHAAAVFVTPAATVTLGQNLAGEPRDELDVHCTANATSVAEVGPAAEIQLMRRGALSRAILLSGALEALLPMTVRYAGERVQFGRPLSAFQAIQQQLAMLAAEVSAARAATDRAVEVCADGFTGPAAAFAVAAAKVRTAQAAGAVAAIAHQVHGAIGMTREHALHLATTRLWSWRAEWRGERVWSEELGRAAVAADDLGLWQLLVGG